jgi:hypothetical protein
MNKFNSLYRYQTDKSNFVREYQELRLVNLNLTTRLGTQTFENAPDELQLLKDNIEVLHEKADMEQIRTQDKLAEKITHINNLQLKINEYTSTHVLKHKLLTQRLQKLEAVSAQNDNLQHKCLQIEEEWTSCKQTCLELTDHNNSLLRDIHVLKISVNDKEKNFEVINNKYIKMQSKQEEVLLKLCESEKNTTNMKTEHAADMDILSNENYILKNQLIDSTKDHEDTLIGLNEQWQSEKTSLDLRIKQAENEISKWRYIATDEDFVVVSHE